MLSKLPEMKHNLCDNFLQLNFKGLSKNIIKYIHQNLRYYESIEQIYLMIVKKYKSYARKKIVISPPLLHRHPLLLRQLNNNQNQTNTSGAHHLKEVNNTGGWLSVFSWCFFCSELIKQCHPQTTPPPPQPT